MLLLKFTIQHVSRCLQKLSFIDFQTQIKTQNIPSGCVIQIVEMLRTAKSEHFAILVNTECYECNILFRTQCTLASWNFDVQQNKFDAKFGGNQNIHGVIVQSTKFDNKNSTICNRCSYVSLCMMQETEFTDYYSLWQMAFESLEQPVLPSVKTWSRFSCWHDLDF